MGTFSIMHWLVVLAVVLLLFGGRGKISSIMGDFGKGLRSFKTGLKGDEQDADGAEDDVEVIEETPAPAKKRKLLMGNAPKRSNPPETKAATSSIGMPIGMDTARPCATVPLSTPRRMVTLLSPKVAAAARAKIPPNMG